jgi:predicted enzyme related to lactoylglutathione lyase
MAALGSLSHIVIDCVDPAALATFWCAALDTTVHMTWKQYVMLEPTQKDGRKDGRKDGVALAFQQVPEAKLGKNRLHLDLFVEVGQLQAATDAALLLGATLVQTNFDDPVTVNVMHDPEGNEFCLVEVPPS